MSILKSICKKASNYNNGFNDKLLFWVSHLYGNYVNFQYEVILSLSYENSIGSDSELCLFGLF